MLSISFVWEEILQNKLLKINQPYWKWNCFVKLFQVNFVCDLYGYEQQGHITLIIEETTRVMKKIQIKTEHIDSFAECFAYFWIIYHRQIFTYLNSAVLLADGIAIIPMECGIVSSFGIFDEMIAFDFGIFYNILIWCRKIVNEMKASCEIVCIFSVIEFILDWMLLPLFDCA